jgi:predicted regulator of Ras-like GTPase activity (Roadblock/LC7/MglB family)
MTTTATNARDGHEEHEEHPELLLERLVNRTAGARHALLLSRDGLKLSLSPGLSVDQADQLAAIASGIQALAHGASVEFGDGSGGVRQSMTEFPGGILFIVGAGHGAHLAVVGDEAADAGVIGFRMNELVEHIGDFLREDPRAGSRAAAAGKLSA